MTNTNDIMSKLRLRDIKEATKRTLTVEQQCNPEDSKQDMDRLLLPCWNLFRRTNKPKISVMKEKLVRTS